MSTITITQLYELFVPKLGKEAAEGLATYLETKPKIELENNLKHLATKEALGKLEVAITKVEGALTKLEDRFTKLEERFTKVEERFTKVEDGLTRSKVEMIKWMFLFWIGQVLAIWGFLLLFLKK